MYQSDSSRLKFGFSFLILLIFTICLYTYTFVHFSAANSNLPNILIYGEDILAFYKAIPKGLISVFNAFKNAKLDPAYLFVYSFISHLFGKNHHLTTYLINMSSLLLFQTYIFLIANLTKSRKAGLTAVVLAAFSPVIYMNFQFFYIDFPLLWLISAFVFYMLRSAFLKQSIYIIPLSAIGAIGLLTKYPYGAYIAGALLFCFIKAVSDIKKRDYKRIRNLSLFILFLLIIISPNFFTINKIMHFVKDPLTERAGNAFFSFAHLYHFTIGISSEFLSPPFMIIFFISLFSLIRKNNGFYFIFLISILIPLSLLILMPHWISARYLLPTLPFFILLISYRIDDSLKTATGKIISLLFLFSILFQYYDFMISRSPILLNKRLLNEKLHLQGYGEYFSNYTKIPIWSETSENGRKVNEIILNNIADELRKDKYSHNTPIVIVPEQYILCRLPHQLLYLMYLNFILWHLDIDAKVSLIEDQLNSLPGKRIPDLYIGVYSSGLDESFDYRPDPDKVFLKRLLKNVYLETHGPAKDSNIKLPDEVKTENMGLKLQEMYNLLTVKKIIYQGKTKEDETLRVFLYSKSPDKIAKIQ